MSKKIISIILTLAMILCQGTLCLGTVSAAEGEYIVEPDFIELSLEASDWATSFVTLENDASGNLVFIDEGHKNDGKERYDTGWMELKNLDIPAGNYFSIELVARVDEAYPARRYNGDIWTSGNDTRPQFYYGGIKHDDSTMNFAEPNSTGEKMGKYMVSGSSSSGYYSTGFETYSCELDGSWEHLKTLTKLRFDANKNSTGRVTVKSIKLIGRPGIKSIGFNSAYDADIDAMPVDPDTIDITLAGSFNSIDGAVSVTDPDGNEVPLAGTSLAGSKAVIALANGTELQAFTTYTVTINENAKVTANKNLQDPIVFTFTTDDSKAPSIFDTIDPDRPSDYTDDNVIWSAEFKTDADVEYIPSKGGIKTEIAYGEYLKYTAPAPTINDNGNLSGSYVDTSFSPAIDANLVNRLQIRMKVVNAVTEGTITGKNGSGEEVTKNRVAPHLQLYFAGVNDNGNKFNMDVAHSYSDDSMYKMMTDDNGNKCTDWFIYDINLNNISSWVAAKKVNAFRFDVMNNCEGVALIDYIRFLGPKMPEIEMIKYNSEFDIDEVQGLPINAETVDIYLTEPIYSVDASGIVFEDSDGNVMPIKNVMLSENCKIVTVMPDGELNPYATYYIGFNDKAMLSATANFTDYVIYETFTTAYRAPSILDAVDPGRPDDAIPAGEEVWSLDFKEAGNLKYFPSSANLKTQIKYGEYLEYVTTDTFIGPSGGVASYYVDSNFKDNLIDSDKYYRLQIRMKVVEQTAKGSADGYFKLYYKGDGKGMREDNAPGGVTYNYRTDAEGRYGTDWFVVDMDLSQLSDWKANSQIEAVRFDFLHNAAGTVLVDYIRLVAMPAVTELSYTNAAGTTVVGDGMTVASDTQYLNIKLSQKLLTGIKYSLVNEYGSEANIDMSKTEYIASENTIKLAILGGLETSSVYTLTVDSSTDLSNNDTKVVQKLYRPLTFSFKTEADPITAEVVKGADSSVINYANNTGDDVVLVAIATVWNGNTFVSKNIVATPVAAYSSVNGVVVNHTAGGNTAEVVVMKYDAAKDNYTMISKMVQ